MPAGFISVGAAGTGGSGNVTPGAPASLYSGDILILCGHSRDNVAWSVDNGYTSKIVGNADSTNRLEVWWKRTAGVEGITTVTHASGNSISTRIYAYRGCAAWGDPFDVVGSVQSNAGSPISTAAITTTRPGCLVCHLFGSQDDNTWGTLTGSVIPTFTSRGAATDTAGTDNSMGLADGQLDQSGTTGTAAATEATNGPDAGASVLFALIPAGTFVLKNYQHFRADAGISLSEKIR